MRRPRTAAGRRLVDAQNAALAETCKDSGEEFVWTPAEEAALERAGDTEDRAESVRKLLQIELKSEEPDKALVVKLSAELRALDRLVVDLIGRLNPAGDEPVKSHRHQRAANSRWERDRSRWALKGGQ
ncbi:hypothetical protein GS528_07255 [Rhodococcus hoagii]|nr:hypothetical protein [Prescottella equi]